MHLRALVPSIMTVAIAALTAAGTVLVFASEGYSHFILALVALTTVVGVGLNVLLGLSGQVSLGHVGFYAIGAYTAAILTTRGANFWLAFPAAGAVAGAIGSLLALPALRVRGPYLAMVTIAFASHRPARHDRMEGFDRWAERSHGARAAGDPRAYFRRAEMALLAVLLAGASLYLFHRLAAGAWGKAMVAVQNSETAARSIGLNPIAIKTVAFAISAMFAGPRRRNLCAADAVRRAGLVSVFTVDPLSPSRDRRRFGLGARPARRGDCNGDDPGVGVATRRVSAAVRRCATARRFMARPRRHHRHLRAIFSPSGSRRGRCGPV
jgi:ABC-type uncharacterized transport system permease subunit